AESISIRAQRNWSEHVLNDQSIQVDNQRKVKVTGLSSHESHDEEHHLTHGARKTQVLADDSLTVVGSQYISAANHLVSAATQVHLHSSVDVVINAGICATINAGGHWISISPAGIFSSVPIQLGGVPLLGMPAVPDLPAALAPQVALPANRSLIPEVQLEAIERGAPFCQACADAKKELS
ncbi:bacteriophage T4 gp5 trimerisation domain-containing protein, partial [Pseudomonas caspiana]